jgi:anti-sigma regulatory factor (Ser/Thr protein kinase)
MHLIPPAQINGKAVLQFIGDLAAAERSTTPVSIDFSHLRRITPLGLVVLTACIMRWHREHREVRLEDLSDCPILKYLQRMDFLKAVGVAIPEKFRRHGSRGRFVPISIIDHKVDEMGANISACLAPGGDEFGHPMCDLYDIAWYVFTETANNVRQHSCGTGYVAAQLTHADGLARIAIADNGKGIRQSFIDSGLDWATGMTDEEAIMKALEPHVSSKGNPTNEGVGLTLVSQLIELMGAWLVVASGTGAVTIMAGGEPCVVPVPDGFSYQGTLIGMAFAQNRAKDYADLLQSAKVNSGLLQKSDRSGNFVT